MVRTLSILIMVIFIGYVWNQYSKSGLYFMPVKLDSTYAGGIESELYIFIGVAGHDFSECKVVNINGVVLEKNDGTFCQFVSVGKSSKTPDGKILTDLILNPSDKFEVSLIRLSYLSNEEKLASKVLIKKAPRIGSILSFGLSSYYSITKSDVDTSLAGLPENWDFKVLQLEKYTIQEYTSKPGRYVFSLGKGALFPSIKKKGREIEFEFLYKHYPHIKLVNWINEKLSFYLS